MARSGDEGHKGLPVTLSPASSFCLSMSSPGCEHRKGLFNLVPGTVSGTHQILNKYLSREQIKEGRNGIFVLQSEDLKERRLARVYRGKGIFTVQSGDWSDFRTWHHVPNIHRSVRVGLHVPWMFVEEEHTTDIFGLGLRSLRSGRKPVRGR